jgi:GNAT superfamily N-acetyltransferase
MTLQVRRAQPEDRDGVLAFCERTLEWGHSIGDVWDAWLADRAGPLLVAEVDGEPAGVGKVTMLSRAEAWLEGLRVNPAFRGSGVAQAMYHAAESEARRRGARVTRYGTPSWNMAIHALSERFGYRRVACFIEYAAPAEPGELPELLHSTESDQAEQLLAASAGLASSGGLYDGGWHCQELRGGRLREHIMLHQAYVVRARGIPAALALVSGYEPAQGLRVGFLGGDAPEVSVLARQLRAVGHAQGLPRVLVVLPVQGELERVVQAAGYERAWDQEMCIYERELSRR